MHTRPVIAVLSYMLGLVCVQAPWAIGVSLWFLGWAWVLFGSLPPRRSERLMSLLWFTVGIAAAVWVERGYQNELVGIVAASGETYWVGKVASPVRITNEKSASTTVELSAVSLTTQVEWIPVRSTIHVRFETDQHLIRQGQRVVAKSELRLIRSLGIAGQYDWAWHAARRGIRYQTRVPGHAWRILDSSGPEGSWPARVRERIWHAAAQHLGPEEAALFAGLVIGEQHRLPESLMAAYRSAGVVHLISISGLHLAIVFSVVRFVFRWLLGRSQWLLLTFHGPMLASSLGLVVAALYAWVAGFQAPTLRALGMLGVVLLAQLLGRRLMGISVLAWAVLGLLAVDPPLVFSPSFQLSCAALVAALVWQRASPTDPSPDRLVKAYQYLYAALWASVAATAWTLPFTAYHFGQFSLIGIIANLPLIPFVSIVLTPLAFLYGCLAATGTTAPLPWFLLDVGLWLCNQLTKAFARLPGAGLRWRLDGVEALAMGGFLLSFTTVACARSRAWRRFGLVLLALNVAIGVGQELRRVWRFHRPFRIDVLSVGQGDAIVVMSRGRALLIDTGGGTHPNAFERVLAPSLEAERVVSLDMLILTHPHLDHVGAAEPLLRTFRVDKLVLPSRAVFWREHPKILETAYRHGVSIEEWQAPQQHDWQALRIEVLNPNQAFVAAATKQADFDPNALSLVLRVESRDGGGCAFLPGDAEAGAERSFLESRVLQPCGLLKVAHHGSRSSTAPDLLEGLRPRWALISAGYRNRYGHPHRETLARLARYGVVTLVTADTGTLTATAFGSDWKVECFHRVACGGMAPLRDFVVGLADPALDGKKNSQPIDGN